jgi:replicative DNA helicase
MENSNRLFNRSVERVILASLIFQPELIEETSSEIVGKDFYIPFYREVFTVLHQLDRRKSIINEELIKEELERRDKYNEEEFFNIFLESPIANIGYHTKELRDRSKKRKLLQLAKTIEGGIFEEDHNGDELEELVREKLKEIDNSSEDLTTADKFEVADLFPQYDYELIEGLPYKRNDLLTFVGATGGGKTAFNLENVWKELKRGNKVVYFSLEMPHYQLIQRLMMNKLNISFNPDQPEKEIAKAKEKIQKAIDDGEFWWLKNLIVSEERDFKKIKSTIRKLKEKDFNLIVVDNLNIIDHKDLDEYERFARISGDLRDLAKKEDLAVILLTQFKKTGDKEATMEDIKGNKAVVDNSDIVILLDTKKNNDIEAEATISVEKNRHGLGFKKSLIFQKSRQKFLLNVTETLVEATRELYREGKEITYASIQRLTSLTEQTIAKYFFEVEAEIEKLKNNSKTEYTSTSSSTTIEDYTSIDSYKSCYNQPELNLEDFVDPT